MCKEVDAITSYCRGLLDDVDKSAAREKIGRVKEENRRGEQRRMRRKMRRMMRKHGMLSRGGGRKRLKT